MRLQCASRKPEDPRHDDVRPRRLAPDDPGDKGAVPAVGRNPVLAVERVLPLIDIPVLQLPVWLAGTPHASEPGVGGRRVLEQPGVGYVDHHALPAVLGGRRSIKHKVVVHLLRLGSGARDGRVDRQDLVRCGDSLTELSVGGIDGLGHRGRPSGWDLEPRVVVPRLDEAEGHHALDDASDVFIALPAHRLPEDRPDFLELGVADEDAAFAVHALDPTVFAVLGNDGDPLVLKRAGDVIRLSSGLVNERLISELLHGDDSSHAGEGSLGPGYSYGAPGRACLIQLSGIIKCYFSYQLVYSV